MSGICQNLRGEQSAAVTIGFDAMRNALPGTIHADGIRMSDLRQIFLESGGEFAEDETVVFELFAEKVLRQGFDGKRNIIELDIAFRGAFGDRPEDIEIDRVGMSDRRGVDPGDAAERGLFFPQGGRIDLAGTAVLFDDDPVPFQFAQSGADGIASDAETASEFLFGRQHQVFRQPAGEDRIQNAFPRGIVFQLFIFQNHSHLYQTCSIV